MVEICKLLLNKCCEELNTYVDNFKQKSIKEPQNNKLPFDECVSGGINAINKIKSILEINQDVTGLKKAFKKTLIQKNIILIITRSVITAINFSAKMRNV